MPTALQVPANVTLTIRQGSTFAHRFRVLNDDDTAADLTGYTARMQVRVSKNATAFMLELTTTNGRLMVDGPNGAVTLSLTSVDTAAINKGGRYDLEIVLDQGTSPEFVSRIAEGKLVLSKEVTK